MIRKHTNFIVIHCSATLAHQDIGRREITEWHTKQRGWKDIGYHFVIRRDGSIEIGRDQQGPTVSDELGAHVTGHNHDSVAICLVGGLDDHGAPQANYTQRQWDALRVLVRAMTLTYPNAVVQGHRDFPNVQKACPCFDVKSWWAPIAEEYETEAEDQTREG